MLSFRITFLDTPADLEAAIAARMERQKVIFETAIIARTRAPDKRPSREADERNEGC